MRVRGVNACGITGAASQPWTIGVDRTPPSDVRFDGGATVYLTSTATLSMPLSIALTGWATDAVGAGYVSGVGEVGFFLDKTPLDVVSVTHPGLVGSDFAYSWRLPESSHEGRLRGLATSYDLIVGAVDVAGNAGAVSDTLHVVVDDTPPQTYANPPQVLDGTTLALSGRADDTTLLFERGPAQPFSSSVTVGDRDAVFEYEGSADQALIVGDVNGDAIDDALLLVAARFIAPETPAKAALFLGRPQGLPSKLRVEDADAILSDVLPVSAGDSLVAAGIGDVNGDGIGDLLIGDPAHESGAGKAYVVFGRRDWPANLALADADWALTMPGATNFGASVSSAGDVNGDGLADFLVGAVDDGSYEGIVWLYQGRERGTPAAQAMFLFPDAVGSPPVHMAGLGDTNGDGLSDFLIAPNTAPVSLVYGRPGDAWPAGPVDLFDVAAVFFSGDGVQQTVSPAGDVNGDGLHDFLIGDPEASQPRVYIVYGRRAENGWPQPLGFLDLVVEADASFVDTADPGARLGIGLAALGDVDGDHRDDFAFSQVGEEATAMRVAIALSRPRQWTVDMPVESATHLITSTSSPAKFGSSLSSGDVNGDAMPDLLVGAEGAASGYLFHGDFTPGSVAGIAQVELGISGPVADSTQPFTATLPASWQSATLAQPGERISTWSGALTVPADGDYRVYARAWDQSGNLQDVETWYQGNVWANTAPVTASGAALTMNAPELTELTYLVLSGTLSSAQPLQHLRVYDGYEWQRLEPGNGDWSLASLLPHHDAREDNFLAVARDAFGTTLYATRTLAIDTRVGERPRLFPNLQPYVWYTDISPTLAITWPVISDAGGISATWASIDDTPTNTVTPAPINEVSRTLDATGMYYGNVRVQDNAGNQIRTYSGPYLVNSTRTPSLILPDGEISFATGEYPTGMLLNADPYAFLEPAALWGTWNDEFLYLGCQNADWTLDRLMAFYFNTTSGGLTETLALQGITHTLPFAADYAFVVGGPAEKGGALYHVTAGDWVTQTAPQSYAIDSMDTEFVFDRSEIQATGAVAMMAYVQIDRMVRVVHPTAARTNENWMIRGSTTFDSSLFWLSMGDGQLPNETVEFVISPTIKMARYGDNALNHGESTSVTLKITNPDLIDYESETVVVEADQAFTWTGVEGATCTDCPSDSGRWELAVDVVAGATLPMTLTAQALGDDLTGVTPIAITATMPHGGLVEGEPTMSRTRYDLDQGVADISIGRRDDDDGTTYFQTWSPGMFYLPFSLEGTVFERCSQMVESYTEESGWEEVCPVGGCIGFSVETSTLLERDVTLRVSNSNGRTSAPVVHTVVADNISPTTEILTESVISGTLAFVRGLAWDTFPTTRAPVAVEVSIDGGRFHPAIRSAVPVSPTVLRASNAVADSSVQWLFPLHLTTQDGVTATLEARAIDEAGNVGPASDPVTVTLDNLGPRVTFTQTESLLEGTVRDGSGVTTLTLSLDGGVHYQPPVIDGEAWSFDIRTWTGDPIRPYAMLHGVDVYGNASHAVFALAYESRSVYLPLVLRATR